MALHNGNEVFNSSRFPNFRAYEGYKGGLDTVLSVRLD